MPKLVAFEVKNKKLWEYLNKKDDYSTKWMNIVRYTFEIFI